MPAASPNAAPGQTEAADIAATLPAATETATPTSSPAPEDVPDLSGETIVLPAFCDQSSPLAGGNAGRIQALEDAVDALNERGGIFGAQLDLRLVDSGGSAEAAQRALAQTVRQFGEGPLALICDAQTAAALREMLNEDEIPALGPADFAERRGFLFGVDATTQEHLGFFLDELASHWAERKPEDSGDEMRLGLISWPQEFSGPLTSDEFLADLQDAGIQISYQAELPAIPDANIHDLVYAMRDANVNVIYTNARGFGLASLLNALQALGLRERFVVGAPAAGYDAQLFEYLADPANAQGLVLTSAWAWWAENENQGIQQAGELGAGEEIDDWGYIQMAGAVALAQHALEYALLDAGFEVLGPEEVARALQGLEAYQVMSGLFTVDFSGGARSLEGLRTWVAGAEPGELVIVE